MNYQKQRHDRGKKIRLSSIDRIGEPYRPPRNNQHNHKEVFYEKEHDNEDNDSLGSIKLYDLSNINDSLSNAHSRNMDRISIRSDVGAPIPLNYRKQRQDLSNVRYTKQEEGVKKAIQLVDERITNTAKKMNNIINKQKGNDNKRQLKVIITATDDQDIVRVCKSLIREYSTYDSTAYTKSVLIFVFIIILVTILVYLSPFSSSQ